MTNINHRVPWNKGKPWSLEHRKRLSSIHKGKVLSEQHKRALSIALTGRKKSPAHIEKVRLANTGKKRSEEFRRKLSLALKGRKVWNKGKPYLAIRGQNHFRWIKDRSLVKRYWTERDNPEYKQWRTKVQTRDNWQCRLRNDECEGRITVHHILPWAQFPNSRYIINNGITLCQHHHPYTRGDEIRFAAYFMNMVQMQVY